MNRNSGTILCLAYSIGLLFTGFWGVANSSPTWQQWLGVILGLVFLSCLSTWLMPHLWRKSPRKPFWLLAGIVAILAIIYFQFRLPQPQANDISYILKPNSRSQIVTVQGKALTEARITSNQKQQFWFEAQQVIQKKNKIVTGKLYVTLPFSEKAEIHSGAKLTIQGILYHPKGATNPGSFDFKNYLTRQGTFAGLKGIKITQKQNPSWGLWKLREKIVNFQVQGLGSPNGELLSSIVLGRQAVDLPSKIKDLFIKTGLAHVLAASGFHVALLLGVVLKFTQSLSPRYRFIIGVIVLIFYVGLTGIQPSIMRSVLMGIGALIGLLLDRKVHSLGSLLLAATILLVLNPLWIWDLGFQLSFLATLGLIVTLPAIEKYLDWLPQFINNIMSITLAASLWTLPLLMYTFSSITTYSILTNVIASPLITLISLGGMLSAAIGLIYPPIGSFIAWLLAYPIRFLLAILAFFIELPASSLAVGKLPLEMMFLIYAVMILVWIFPAWQRRWWIVSLFVVSLIVIPIIYTRLTLTQVTVLAAKTDPVIVIQNRDKVVLINGNDPEIAKYTVLPFLTYQGINQIDSAIALNSHTDWSAITNTLPIQETFDFFTQEKWVIDSLKIESLSQQIPIIQIHIANKTWLYLSNKNIPEDLFIQSLNTTPLVLLGSSQSFNKDWLKFITPQVTIINTAFVSSKTQKQLKQQHITLYWTGRDGSIQWHPKKGFQTSVISSTGSETVF